MTFMFSLEMKTLEKILWGKGCGRFKIEKQRSSVYYSHANNFTEELTS